MGTCHWCINYSPWIIKKINWQRKHNRGFMKTSEQVNKLLFLFFTPHSVMLNVLSGPSCGTFFFFAIFVKYREPTGMKHERDFSLNTNVKRSLQELTRIILQVRSDMLLAGVWIYNSMYLTHFLSKCQSAQVCMRVSIFSTF